MTVKELRGLVEAQNQEIERLKVNEGLLAASILELETQVKSMTPKVNGLVTSVNSLLSRTPVRYQGQRQQTTNVKVADPRPPDQGGWVPSLGMAHQIGICPIHGQVHLNRQGCCPHCYNEAARARSDFNRAQKQGTFGATTQMNLSLPDEEAISCLEGEYIPTQS